MCTGWPSDFLFRIFVDLVQDLYVKELKSYKAPPAVRAIPFPTEPTNTRIDTVLHNTPNLTHSYSFEFSYLMRL